MKRLLLIDSHAFLHRAFHALPPLTTGAGEQVGAVYGFFLAFFKAIKEFRPEYVVAAFDTAAPTFRHKKFAEYKATRPKTPGELVSQFKCLREALEAMGVFTCSAEGYEADDVIGTVVSIASRAKDLETIILTGDMDTAQLVQERVMVSVPRKGVQGSTLYTPSSIREKFGGLGGTQIVDYKGLRGDSADNIPGVKGIGEKTAIALISRYGSLEKLYEAIGRGVTEGIAPAILATLRDHKKDAFQGKRLATIERALPIDFSLEKASRSRWNVDGARRAFEELGFLTLAKRLRELFEQEEPSQSPQPSQDARSRVEQMYAEGMWSEEIYRLELSLLPVIEHMQDSGVMIDAKLFHVLAKELGGELMRLTAALAHSAGKEFNPNSPSQLKSVLFETLSLSPQGVKKTPKGVLSTASEELEKMRALHPIVDLVLSYRELHKLQTTYVLPLPKLADSNGRVHSRFDQLGAATGRVSSSHPNLQNIPAQGSWARRIREGFVAPRGRCLLSFDYAQMELRVAAHMSNDRKMAAFFAEGADIHTMTAAEVFGMPVADVDEEIRRKAKALNFGVIYGMGPRSFSQSTGVSLKEAESFIEQYFIRFPGIAAYIERAKTFAKERGYAETLFGRKRFIPEIRSGSQRFRAAAERIAVNHPIQGTSADIMKMAMRSVWEAELLKQSDLRMLIQIHDELLFECDESSAKERGERVCRAMESAVSLSVPLPVRVKQGKNWGEMSQRT